MKGYVIALALAAIVIGLASWGNPTGALVGDLPLMAIIATGVFAIQWLGLLHASAFTTERYYDLVGSLTYISVVLVALAFSAQTTIGQWLIGGCIVVWAGRLGSFLFRRVLAVGEDQRFRAIKKSTPRFWWHGHYKGYGCSSPPARVWQLFLRRTLTPCLLYSLLD